MDADVLLTKFCQWQHQLNDHNPSSKKHWDVAVLLTKQNLCSASDPSCNTLGLAEKYTVCNPSKSCVVIEDTGLATAFTITHEIGHLYVFNIPRVPLDGGNIALTESEKGFSLFVKVIACSALILF